MPNLILQPAAGAKAVLHLQRTILNSVTIDEVRRLLHDDELRKVEAAAVDGKFHVWGAPDKESAKNTWERFADGDYVLFYANLRFRHVGLIAGTFQSRELGKYLWPDPDSTEQWPYIFLVTDLRPVDIPLTNFIRKVGYASNFVVQRMYILPDDTLRKLMEGYATLEEALDALATGIPGDPRLTSESYRFFVLQISKDSPYQDVEDSEYNFRLGIPNSRRLENAARNGDVQFVYYAPGPRQEFIGYGKIRGIEETPGKESSAIRASVHQYTRADHPVTLKVAQARLPDLRILQYGIIPVSEDIYRGLVSLMQQEPVDRVSLLKTRCAEEGLIFEERVFSATRAALDAGLHAIFLGPPGTGKTTLARLAGEVWVGKDRLSITTATSDWTTFETIGGYVPDTQGTLRFKLGLFLQALRDNKWLLIDELNRADVDKAFGQLFTLLSGTPSQSGITLPFEDQTGKNYRITASSEGPSRLLEDGITFVLTPRWRILATMNIYDKASLFQMSYAFMRRFAFIEVANPPKAQLQEIIMGWCREAIGEQHYSTVATWLAALDLEEREFGLAGCRKTGLRYGYGAHADRNHH